MLGREWPRVATFEQGEEPEYTLGYEAIRFADEMLHKPLMPWQKRALINGLATDAEGNLLARTLLIIVARQNGKTTLLMVLILFLMYTGKVKLVLGTAPTEDVAKEAWEGAVELAQDDPELNAEIEKVQVTNGAHMLRLINRARYIYKTTKKGKSRTVGRGYSAQLLVLDELREHQDWDAWSALSKTTMAQDNGLIVCLSNAGDDKSLVLNGLRERALAKADPSLVLMEWSAEQECDINDREQWAYANPALGYKISELAIAGALATDPPAKFRTEVLCQRVPSMNEAIDFNAWTETSDTTGALDVRARQAVLCLDVAPDMKHVALVAAGEQPDGRIRVEVIESWESPDAARAELPTWMTKIKPRAFGWFPGGPTAAIAADLRKIKRNVELKAGDVPAVCQGFAEQIAARKITHSGDALLTAQVNGAGKLYSGDGWRFVRERTGGSGHVDAVYAAAGAVHLIRTLPPAPSAFKIL